MGIISKDTLLGGTDLIEREIELPSIGGSVRILSLAAAYSNQAVSDALEMVTVEHRGRQQQTMSVDTTKLEALKVLHGLIEPKLSSIEEAYTFSQRFGPAWNTVVKAIDDISGIDAKAVERTNAMFQPGGSGEARPSAKDAAGAGNGRSDLPVRTGA